MSASVVFCLPEFLGNDCSYRATKPLIVHLIICQEPGLQNITMCGAKCLATRCLTELNKLMSDHRVGVELVPEFCCIRTLRTGCFVILPT